MKLNATDSQKLVLDVLKVLSTSESEVLFNHIKERSKTEDLKDTSEFLYLCLSFIQEKHNNPTYCESFVATSKAAVSKISSKKRVLIKDVLQAYQWKNDVQFNRISKNEAIIQKKNIEALCSNFSYESDKRFWANQLLSFFPSTIYQLTRSCDEGEPFEVEQKGLIIVLEFLNMLPAVRETALTRVKDQTRIFLLSWMATNDCATRKSKLGENPISLFDTVYQLLDTEKKTLSYLLEEILQTKSWYIWKHQWHIAEEKGFKSIPEARIQRWQVFLIIVEFQLDLFDALTLLQLAGYRLDPSGIDAELWRYICYGEGEKKTLEARIWSREISL